MAVFKEKFEVDVSGAITGLEAVEKKITSVVEKTSTLRNLKASAKVDVDVDASDVDALKKDIAKIDGQTVEVKVDTEGATKSISGLTAGIGAALGTAALSGIQSIVGGLLDGAEAADAFGDTLAVAFTQQGIADVEGEIESVRATTLALANDLGLPTERVRELAKAVATIGGVSGEQAEGLTKLATSIETFTEGSVKGEAIVKAFSRGIADPEGAAAIDALAKKYPQLAETLKSTASASEKLAQANIILGPSFAAAKAGAEDAGGTIQRTKNLISEGFESIGEKLFTAIGPVLSFLSDNLSNLLPIVYGLAAGVAVYALAMAGAAISTALASVAGLTFNAVLAANPIGAVVVVVALLVAGLFALADAFEVSAEEALADAEANKKLIETQIKSNEERQVSVKSTASLAKEFENLANKTKRTKEEEERLKVVQGELDAQYPDLIDQTATFATNLNGVTEIGKRASVEMEGLTKAGIALAAQLSEATKVIAASQRDVAISSLRGILGSIKLLNTEGTQFRQNWIEVQALFAKDIYTAKTADGIDNARKKITEFLNAASKNPEIGLDAEDLLKLYAGVAEVVGTATGALVAFGLVKEPPPKKLLVDTGDPDKDKDKDKDKGKEKAAKTELELKQQTLKAAIALRAQDLLDLQAKNQELVILEKLSAKEAALSEATKRAELATLNRADAVRILGASLDGSGVVISTTLKLSKDESLESIKETIQSLSNTLRSDKLSLLKLDTEISKEKLTKNVAEAIEEANIIAGAKFFDFDESTIQRFVDKGAEGLDEFVNTVARRVQDLDAKLATLGVLASQQQGAAQQKTLDEIQKLQTDRLAIIGKAANAEVAIRKGAAAKISDVEESINKAIAGLDFSDIFVPLEEGAEEAFEKIGETFRAGLSSYQDALDEMQKASEDTASVLDRVGLSMSTALDRASAAMAKTSEDVIRMEDGFSKGIALMAISTGAAFASMAVGGEDVWTAIARSAFDGLQALVPILSAQILALALSQPLSVITSGAKGVIEWAAMTALIQVAVSGARAAAGFQGGGPTGDNIGAGDIAGVVHGREFVADREMYSEHGDLLHHLWARKSLGEFPEIKAMMAKNNIASYHDVAGSWSNSSVNIQYVSTDLAPLQNELVAVRKQLVAMEALHRTASEITVTADEGYHTRQRKRAAIRDGRN